MKKLKKVVFTIGFLLSITIAYTGLNPAAAQMPDCCTYSSGDLCCKDCGEPGCWAISNAKPDGDGEGGPVPF